VQEHDVTATGQTDVTGPRCHCGSWCDDRRGNVGAVARFNVDLRGRKRFLTVVTSPGNTVAVVTSARLSKAEVHGVTAAEVGVTTSLASELDTQSKTPKSGRLGCRPAARLAFLEHA
jgi:hypothetical protein